MDLQAGEGTPVYIEFQGEHVSTVIFLVEGQYRTYIFEYSPGHGVYYFYDDGDEQDGLDMALAHISEPDAFWLDPRYQLPENFDSSKRMGNLPGDIPVGNFFNSDIWEELHEGCETHYCLICKDIYPTDDTCPHLIGIQYSYKMAGCGSDAFDEEELRSSFSAMLGKTHLALELRQAMASQRYHIDFLSDIFGPFAVCCSLNSSGYDPDGESYGDRFKDDLTAEEEEAMSLAVLWLVSMEQGITTKAEQQVIGWIDAWLAEQAKEEAG